MTDLSMISGEMREPLLPSPSQPLRDWSFVANTTTPVFNILKWDFWRRRRRRAAPTSVLNFGKLRVFKSQPYPMAVTALPSDRDTRGHRGCV